NYNSELYQMFGLISNRGHRATRAELSCLFPWRSRIVLPVSVEEPNCPACFRGGAELSCLFPWRSRIVLPVSVEEYQVGQLYAVAEASKNETGGGEGVEVIDNEPYEKDGEKGQYTHKIYHLTRYAAHLINEYMKEGFIITIETWHKPDMGDQENVHGLEKSKWDNVQIVDIDIADKNSIRPKDYNPEHDPAIFKSVKTGRGPLGPEWKVRGGHVCLSGLQGKKSCFDNPDCPHMCATSWSLWSFKVVRPADDYGEHHPQGQKRINQYM
ncbi:hypothetical protein KUCAC02_033150, partial [Chaenocephalus aceratus]